MSKVIYEFRKGSRINLDAKKTHLELEQIRLNNKDNQLKPEEVLEYARNNIDSELHKGFEWDMEKAAYQYNLQQARQIIYNIRIIKLDDNKVNNTKKIEYIPYTHLDTIEGYKSTIEVYKNKIDYEQLKNQAYRDLLYWKKKYENIIEFENIFKEIDNERAAELIKNNNDNLLFKQDKKIKADIDLSIENINKQSLIELFTD